MKRFFEVLPGALAWTTIVLMVLLSWRLPALVSVFIILFDIYWLLKVIYLSLHLRSTFSRMKRNMAVDWLARLTALPGRDWESVYHLVILPMYDEPYEVIRESFARLLAAHYPKKKMMVVLATEERAGEAARKAGERIAR